MESKFSPGFRRTDDDIMVQDSFVSPNPRLVKNYIKSQIFSEECFKSNCSAKKMVSPSTMESTQDRLFGSPVSTPSPRRRAVNDTYRSNVFAGGDGSEISENITPRKMLPVTDDKLMGKGDFFDHNISKYGNRIQRSSKQSTFSPSDYRVVKVRQPPGGFCHAIW